MLEKSEPCSCQKIDSFRGEYAFLSNFHPCQVYHDGILYPSVEHAFQAAKTLSFGQRWEISQYPADLKGAARAKRTGKTLVLRPDWSEARVSIMHELVLQKFARHPALRHMLLATGNAELIEGNYWHDHFWGVCHGTGENHLGLILMDVRSLLRA